MKRIQNAEHSVVYQMSSRTPFNYFGWPTVARMDDGTLIVGASGFRAGHVCPFGRSVLWRSSDNGRSWSSPEIVNDSPIDDRDLGVTPLRDGKFLISWFTCDTRFFYPGGDPIEHPWNFRPVLQSWNEETVAANLGSFVRVCNADGSWNAPVPVKVSSPHGPIRLANGKLLYLGAIFGTTDADGKLHFSMQSYRSKCLQALESSDDGATWQELGIIKPVHPDSDFCEPDVVELPSGRLIGAIRDEADFSMWQIESDDGGRNWSTPHRILPFGAPPHLLRHSSGVLVLAYGYRRPEFSERVMLSYDDGQSWDADWVLCDAPFVDMGYPSSVELPDGSILTVYYQSLDIGTPCAIRATRWELPGRR